MDLKRGKPNSGIFIRPNIRGFVFGGVLIVLVLGLIPNGESRPRRAARPFASAMNSGSGEDIGYLLSEVMERPRSQILMRLSRYYEQKGQYRKAILYLRNAGQLEQLEESL